MSAKHLVQDCCDLMVKRDAEASWPLLTDHSALVPASHR